LAKAAWVYRARDLRLGRDVALKVLPAALVADDDRRWRFVQEAKAASALNHPNILTIYEVGEADGVSFLATELIDGHTLRARLGSGRLPMKDAIDLAIQASAGLSAAHAAGIVHRDIKPENIMVRHDGYLKILDFGLAKLTERALNDDAGAPTTLAVKTSPGVVMGTARYMSPEQARGLPVDARADIFSLGAVMYETLAGRPAFDGETANHVIVAILEREPTSLVEIVPDTPPELERIVTKALAKDVDDRYQTVKDLAVDLRRLKQRLQVDTDRTRAASTPSLDVARASPAATTRGWWMWPLVIASVAVLAAGAAFGLSHWLAVSHDAAPTFDQMTVTKLTDTGTATQTAISPDGRYVVYVATENGQDSLWIRQVATASRVQIAAPSRAGFTGVTFSPDGNFLYYTKTDTGARPALYQTPVLGGPSQKILDDISGAVSFAPDGRQMVFDNGDGTALMVANVDGSGARAIAHVSAPDYLNAPSWSPDGTTIAVARQSFAPGYHGSVFVVPAAGGSLEPMTPRSWYAVRAVHWLSPTRLALVAADQSDFPDGYQVWLVSSSNGAVARLTNDVNNHATLGATADGRSVVTIQRERASTLWIFPPGDLTKGEQVTTGLARRDGIAGLTWTSDGKLVSGDGSANGGLRLFERGDGSGRPFVTANGLSARPSVCGDDDAHVVFASDRSGAPHIWRVDADGGNARQIVDSAAGEEFAACSPDGRWIAYGSFGDRAIWKADIDGGHPVVLRHEPSAPVDVAISPDGRRIAYYVRARSGSADSRLTVIASSDGAPIGAFTDASIRPSGSAGQSLAWTSDSTALVYVRTVNGVGNLWTQPLSGGPPKQLTSFTSGLIFSQAWSRDGRLALSRGSMASDVVLITLGERR
jgi:Tol biopolymer transport system component